MLRALQDELVWRALWRDLGAVEGYTIDVATGLTTFSLVACGRTDLGGVACNSCSEQEAALDTPICD